MTNSLILSIFSVTNIFLGMQCGEGASASSRVTRGLLESCCNSLSLIASCDNLYFACHALESTSDASATRVRALMVPEIPPSGGKDFNFMVVTSNSIFTTSFGVNLRGLSLTNPLTLSFLVQVGL